MLNKCWIKGRTKAFPQCSYLARATWSEQTDSVACAVRKRLGVTQDRHSMCSREQGSTVEFCDCWISQLTGGSAFVLPFWCLPPSFCCTRSISFSHDSVPQTFPTSFQAPPPSPQDVTQCSAWILTPCNGISSSRSRSPLSTALTHQAPTTDRRLHLPGCLASEIDSTRLKVALKIHKRHRQEPILEDSQMTREDAAASKWRTMYYVHTGRAQRGWGSNSGSKYCVENPNWRAGTGIQGDSERKPLFTGSIKAWELSSLWNQVSDRL